MNVWNTHAMTMVSRHGEAVVLAVAGAFLLWANVVTPLWADDYCRFGTSGLLEPFQLAWR